MTLTEKEKAAIFEFRRDHKCSVSKGTTADYSLHFGLKSGIGISCEIECECGEGLDVTDYGSW